MRRSSFSWCVAGIFVVAAIATSLKNTANAWADEPSAPRLDRPARVVRLVVSANDKDAAALEASLAELLARLGDKLETIHVERVDTSDPTPMAVSAPGMFAVAWVDLRDPLRASCVIISGEGGHVAAQRSIPRSGSSAVAVEEIAHIVQATVEDMADEIARAAPPPTASAPPPPAPPPPAPPPPPPVATVLVPAPIVAPGNPDRIVEHPASGSKYDFNVGGYLIGRAFGSDSNAVIGGGAQADLRIGRGAFRPVISLGGAYYVPFDTTSTLVKVDAKALTLRLTATASYRLSDRISIEAGPSFGTDIFWTTPEAVQIPTNRLEPESTTVSPTLGGVLGVRFAVTRGADMFLMLVTDVDLAPHRFVIKDDAGVGQTVWSPMTVRPALAFGFTFNVAGDAYDPAAPR